MLKTSIEEHYIKPAKIFGNLYFVGIRAVCTHLIDTGNGLIIIDPGYSEALPTVINNIRTLGFDPKDIKYVLLSHAHYDHMDATAELVGICGAKTFIGKADLPLLTGQIYHYPIKSFTPDVLINDGDVISLGNTDIKCISTPGHTDGTTSFFFNVTDGISTYRAGMFGGAGINTLLKEFLIEHSLSFDCREKMIHSINKIINEKVDIFLGNHLNNNRTEEKLSLLGKSVVNPFIENSQRDWEHFLKEKREKVLSIIRNES